MIIKLLQGILNGAGVCLSSISSLLPVSPFIKVLDMFSVSGSILGYINYFFPVAECVALLEGWGVAITIFYIFKPIMLWIKSCN